MKNVSSLAIVRPVVQSGFHGTHLKREHVSVVSIYEGVNDVGRTCKSNPLDVVPTPEAI